MDRQRRIELLAELGEQLLSEGSIPKEVINSARIANPWFTEDSIRTAIKSIASHFLNKEALSAWMDNYKSGSATGKKIGLILAGNIPLVGFHDIMTVFITGNVALIKLSERDTILPKYIINELIKIESTVKDQFLYLDRLENYDAVIATGSNTTGKYFEKYFSKVPHIIRRNRNAIAVVHQDSTLEDMELLSRDMLSYFGLGCRNVSKLYLEEGVELGKIFEPTEKLKAISDHNKYKNNYDYTYALFLMNNEKFFTNDFFILRENEAIASRISTAHYEYFSDSSTLAEQLESQLDQIQCIVSDRHIGDLSIVPFGAAQMPGLADYADGVDTVEFLLAL